ncbi:MAG: hypothetical protein U0230_12210 [Polyangiales bacterium]
MAADGLVGVPYSAVLETIERDDDTDDLHVLARHRLGRRASLVDGSALRGDRVDYLPLEACPARAAFMLDRGEEDDSALVVVRDIAPSDGQPVRRTLPEDLDERGCALLD